MGRADSQIAALKRHKTFLDFSQDNLGDDLLLIAAIGVQNNIRQQQAPDGTPWAPLSEKYAEWKAFHYPSEPPGVLHFLMAMQDEIMGTVYMSNNEARMTYGITSEARDEMEWFSNGDPSKNRPARPFWGFTEESIEASTDRVARRLADIL